MTGMMRDMRTSPRAGRRLLALLAVGLFVVGLSACGGDDDDSTAAPNNTNAAASETTAGSEASSGAAVTIQQFAFTVNGDATAGTELTIENKDTVTHTFTSDDGKWDSIEIEGGKTGTITVPSQAGDYKFHCEIHKSMTGTLTVK